jgi:hypothetical protein
MAQEGNGYSVLLAVCSAICPASFGHVLLFFMGQNILVNEWIFYAIHLLMNGLTLDHIKGPILF